MDNCNIKNKSERNSPKCCVSEIQILTIFINIYAYKLCNKNNIFFYIVLKLLVTMKNLKSNLAVPKLLGEVSFPAPPQDAVKLQLDNAKENLPYYLKAIY